MIAADDFTGPGTAETWPQIGRGGHLRNAKGQALVVAPGGKRHLIYNGASDWPLDAPYDGDLIHGERGTHVHELCDRADRGEPLDDDFIAHGISLGITAWKQAYIHARWTVFLKAHGLTVTHVEAIVVNDAWRTASNIDRMVTCPDGTTRVLDIKSARNVVKVAYAVQLAGYAHPDCVPYDPATGERGTWA